MKKLLGIMVLGLLWCNYSFADSSWIKYPLDNNETWNFNMKSVIEVGPDQYKVETVKTKDPKKLEYQKKAIEKLTKYCGKEPGKYKVPEELLTEGEITKEDYHTVSGLKPGEIMVLKHLVAFEMPYIQFRGDILIFCATKIHSGTKTDFNYTPENEESVINENIRRLYDEQISIAYYDCRRRMRASDWGDGEIHWYPVREGRLTYSLHRFFCAHID